MNIYNINPSKFLAKHARKAQADRTRRSIDYLMNECSNKIGFQKNKIKDVLTKTIEVQRFMPEVHYLHHRLQSAMRAQKISEVKNFFLKLITSLKSNNHENEWIHISSIGKSDWEKFIVKEAMRLTDKDLGKKAEIKPVKGTELILAINVFNAAINLLARYDSDMFDEISEQVKVIKLFQGKVTRGLTDIRILGAMLIRIPDHNADPLLYFLEHLLHEASHIHLNCLMSIDPLILNSPEEKYTSPLRSDPRPMVGVFHATFVSARIARSFMTIFQKTNNEKLLQTLAETLDETIRGVNVINKHAKLTIQGQELVKNINELIDSSKKLSVWKSYNFSELRNHRFGIGTTKINEFHRAVS